MASKKQRADAAKKKEKRTKLFAIVGCVLLVAVGAYEIPPMLAIMNKKPPNTTYDPGPSTGRGGPLPNIAAGTAGGPAATATASSSGLVNTDVPPTTSAGQLVSFSVFQSKNPFAPQVSSTDTGATVTQATTANKPGADVPGSTTTNGSTPTPTTSAPGGGVVPPAQTAPAPTTTTTTTTTTTAQPAQATVAISVNGVVTQVASQGTFPAGSPVFRLVSWAKGTAQIGIVGGSYQTGDATLTLHVGMPITLENQTDSKRYRIELLSTG